MSAAPSADTKGSFQGNKSTTILSFTQRDSESHCPLWLFSQHTEGPRAQLGEPRWWWWLFCQESSGGKLDSGCGFDLPVEALSLDLQAPELVLDEVSQRLPHLQLRRSEKEH